MWQDVCELVGERYVVNQMGDTITEECIRTVYCDVSSIGIKRQIEAMSAGLKLSYKITLSDVAEYNDEEIVIYKGIRYNVINVYVNSTNAVELTLSRN